MTTPYGGSVWRRRIRASGKYGGSEADGESVLTSEEERDRRKTADGDCVHILTDEVAIDGIEADGVRVLATGERGCRRCEGVCTQWDDPSGRADSGGASVLRKGAAASRI